MSFAKALLKRTSEAILQKAKNFENQMGLESLKEVNDLLSKEYILKDSDVQQIKEGLRLGVAFFLLLYQGLCFDMLPT